MFAQDNVGGVAGGHEGHLRTTIFDENCNKVADDTTCLGGATPTPPPTGSITVCKYYDKNANGFQDAGELTLTGWPFCIDPLDGGTPAMVTQLTANGGCATWSNLTTPGDYIVTEANANESNWFHSTGGTSMIMLASGGTETRTFRQLLHVAEWWTDLGLLVQQERQQDYNRQHQRNRNDPDAGRRDPSQLVPAGKRERDSPYLHQQLLRLQNLVAGRQRDEHGLHAVRAVGSVEAGRQLRWYVDGNAFDLCSHKTVNNLITAACDSMTGPGNQLVLAGNPSRPGQEMLKNCIDAINNNGDVVPVAPCPYSFPNPPAPCP